MEYEFRRDLLGNVQAHFSMGHEAIASWLASEKIASRQSLAVLYQVIEDLQSRKRWDYFLAGQEFNLTLTRTEAVVRSASLPDHDMEEDLVDDMSFYDQELMADCGLDDFKVMLEAWEQFLGRQKSV